MMMKKAGGASGADVDGELKKISAAGDNARVAAYNQLSVGCVSRKDVGGLTKLVLHCT